MRKAELLTCHSAVIFAMERNLKQRQYGDAILDYYRRTVVAMQMRNVVEVAALAMLGLTLAVRFSPSHPQCHVPHQQSLSPSNAAPPYALPAIATQNAKNMLKSINQSVNTRSVCYNSATHKKWPAISCRPLNLLYFL
jgi:hypothetical protein